MDFISLRKLLILFAVMAPSVASAQIDNPTGGGGGGPYLPLTGGTLTGALTATQYFVGTPGYTPSGTSFGIWTCTAANNYCQLSMQNLSATGSSDFVVTSSDGSDSTHYADMGINGATSGSTPFTNAHAAYWYSTDSEIDIGALGTGGAINFYAGGGTSSPTSVGSIGSAGLSLNGSTSGTTTVKATATASGTLTLPAVTDTIATLGAADQAMSGGVNLTPYGYATGGITVDCGKNPEQYVSNNGAFTITAPASDGNCLLQVRNTASAGAIAFSGFSVGSSTGDALTTTSGNVFWIFIARITDATGAKASYSIKALQ